MQSSTVKASGVAAISVGLLTAIQLAHWGRSGRFFRQVLWRLGASDRLSAGGGRANSSLRPKLLFRENTGNFIDFDFGYLNLSSKRPL
jgi:hypothetical protein